MDLFGPIGFAAARWLGYFAVFLATGCLTLRWLLLPRIGIPVDEPLLGRREARYGSVAGSLLLLSLAVRLVAQANSFVDPGEPLTGELVGAVLGSAWGHGWIAQTASAGLITIGFGWALRRKTGFTVAGIGVLGAIASAPFTGHAIGLEQAGRFGFILDALHFGAGAVWLGTLAVLVVAVLLPAKSPLAPMAIMSAFSPIALVAGGLTMTLGAIIGYRYLGGISTLFSSSYGRTLLLKLAALAGVAGLGAVNWRVVVPALKRSGNPRTIRRTALAEIGLGLVLLAITAVLVSVSPPGSEH
jgi:copper transport protein